MQDVSTPTAALRVPGHVLLLLRRARDYADRSYTRSLTLEEPAEVESLSKYHFLRLFKSTNGVTPMEYVSRRRIERAQDLLRTRNMTVTELCMAVGFSSLGSFSNRFTTLVGENPSDFQQRYASLTRIFEVLKEASE